jgi:apolipoprotein N-acyltransferase
MASIPRSPLLLLLAASAAGGAYALAFPPYNVPGVAFVTLAPLFAAVLRLPPRGAALAGGLWAGAATAALGHWLPATIARFFEVPLGLGWLALLALASLPAALPIASACAALAWLARRGVRSPLLIGAVFGLTEWARTYFPGLPLPYAPLASAALPDALVQSVDVLGVFGLGMLVAALAATFALGLLRARFSPRLAAEVALVVALLLAALVGGRARLDAELEAGAPLRVAAVQPGVALRLAAPGALAGDTRHARALEATRALVGGGHDLVVWPEHALGFYLREETADADTVLALSRTLDADLLLGGPHYRYAEPEPRYFASAFLLGAGELRGRHDKTRLIPLAEVAYAPGDRLRPLEGRNARVGALVCAEVLFPDVARALARAGAEVLANPSNDSWLVPPAAEHLLRLATLRAIENRRPLVRATPTGVSALIDAQGRVLARSRSAGGEVVEARLHAGREVTLTQRFGDWPVALAACGVAAAALAAKTKRRKHA